MFLGFFFRFLTWDAQQGPARPGENVSTAVAGRTGAQKSPEPYQYNRKNRRYTKVLLKSEYRASPKR